MSGVNNNGSHSANGITALFIATGQDVANVAESSAAFAFAELLENGDYYRRRHGAVRGAVARV